MEAEDAGVAATTFPSQLASVAAARRFVLQETGLGVDHPIALATSELASNAVLYAGTDFIVSVCEIDGMWRVEVVDGALTLPVVDHLGPDAVAGRGLGIVDAIVDHWGVERRETGKAVWFEVASGRHENDFHPGPGSDGSAAG